MLLKCLKSSTCGCSTLPATHMCVCVCEGKRVWLCVWLRFFSKQLYSMVGNAHRILLPCNPLFQWAPNWLKLSQVCESTEYFDDKHSRSRSCTICLLLLFSFLFNNSIMVAYELNYPFSLRNSLDTRKKGASLSLLTCSWHLVDFFVS